MKPRTPRTVAQATELAATYADVAGQLAAVEAARQTELGRINAAADAEAGPLLERIAALSAALAAWWRAGGNALAPKGRKSAQLGGCMIGTRASRSTLTIAGDEDAVVAVLGGLRWAKPLLRVTTKLNKSTLLSSLDGKHKVALAELGIGRTEATDTFFIDRVEQAGTIGTLD